MNKTALLHEAKQQQQALRQLSLWKRIAMLLSSCAAVLAWWGIAGSGLRFAGGVCGGNRTGHPQRKPQCRQHFVGGGTGIKEKIYESTTISAAVHGY